ncbi:GNAT family N-acetyltransferase [Aeromicrobium panaciterrae]|uniref:GNAT family N-acetyltransferase n=1 Tax=Aeromicrobium panaciterrae TaxID=363861 RepID=UPI0031E3836D
MITIDRVGWDDADAVRLRDAMTAEIREMYSDDPTSQNRDGRLDIDPVSIVLTVLLRDDERPVGHVALRRMGEDLEIKRMYVVPERRGGDLADQLLAAVEHEARTLAAPRLILHTGDRQRAALAFYSRHGYTPIDVYPPYEQLAYSQCFEKVLG